MNATSQKLLGTLAAVAALMMAGGLMSACSKTPTADAGTGSGGGTTGGTCSAASATCTVSSECCQGLTCSGGVCTGTTCAKVTGACTTTSQCCTPLVCDNSGDANNGTCIAPVSGTSGGTGGGCALSPAFGGCITAANCAPPNLCQPAADGGGYCGPSTVTQSAVCIPNAGTCSATTGQPCCGGSCVNSVCVPRSFCGIKGQGCNVAGDCCNRFTCVQGAGADNGDGGTDGGVADGGDAGTTSGGTSGGGTSGGSTGGGTTGGTTFTGACEPSCGAYLDPCVTTNNNADCCSDEGFTCLSIDGGTTAGVCDYAQFQDTAGNPIYCGGPCSAFPCQLSTSCQVSATGVDPCASAGLVCDQQGTVCRNPSEQDTCLPGGPACQPLANSTATDIQCLPAPSKFGGAASGYSCFQPCAITDPGTGTSDCVDPLMTCVPMGGSILGAECFFNELAACTTPFGPCNSSAVGDGVCIPYNFSNGTAGLCFQATLTGGAPGSACNNSDNRQNGGFCDPTSYCLYGTCEANCNAGTSGTPGCAQDAGTGNTVGCADLFGQGVGSANPAATAFGVCSVDCDFTSATGGGCSTVGGVPEKCLPPAYFGLADAPTGICVEAPAPGTGIAIGQPCPQSSTLVDTCVDGSLCLGNQITIPNTCIQLCTNVGTAAGQAPCKANQACYAINFGTPEAHEGYCSVDGGVGPGLN